jgi:hypothetical protein
LENGFNRVVRSVGSGMIRRIPNHATGECCNPGKGFGVTLEVQVLIRQLIPSNVTPVQMNVTLNYQVLIIIP